MYFAYSLLADSCGMLSEARGQKRFDPAASTSHYHGLRTQTWNSSYILTNLVVDWVIDQLQHDATESGALQIGVAKYQDTVTYRTGISYTSVLASSAIFFYVWATDGILCKKLALLRQIFGLSQSVSLSDEGIGFLRPCVGVVAFLGVVL